jgi:uncharacterized protein
MSKSDQQKNVINPIGTALWLIENTSLTFEQIADFCCLYFDEVQSIADGIMGANILPSNPIMNGSLNKEEIAKCEKSPKDKLKQSFDLLKNLQLKTSKRKKYTPMAQRRNRPEAILWLVNFASELSDAQIIKIVRTTKSMIASIRERTYKDFAHLVAKDPVLVGFCSQRDLDSEIEKAKNKPKQDKTGNAPEIETEPSE